MMESAMYRVAETTGCKIAAAINACEVVAPAGSGAEFDETAFLGQRVSGCRIEKSPLSATAVRKTNDNAFD